MKHTTRTVRTSAKRALLKEGTITLLIWRVSQGTTYNMAAKLTAPGMSPIAVLKLVRYYEEMERALTHDDTLLAATIRDSLFPAWLHRGQPDDAVYFDHYPYGFWSDSI